jgi:Fe-S cluster assembly protein SufD
MTTAPNILIRGTRQTETLSLHDFSFTEADIPQSTDPKMTAYRQAAWETYKKLPFPTLHDEAWRRTDIRKIDFSRLTLSTDGGGKPVELPGELLASLTSETTAGQIILYPDQSIISLGEELKMKGVLFTDWQTAERDYADLLAKVMGKVVRPEDGKFAALASAMAQTGIFLYVPAGVKLSTPIHSIFWGDDCAAANFTHVVVCLEPGSSVTYVHESASQTTDGDPAFHNGLVEIKIGEGASLQFVELQSLGQNVDNITHERAVLDRDANLEWIFGALGSRLTKNFSEIDLAGQGSTAKFSGFYFADGLQHFDHDSQQNHLAPNTTSDLLFKGVVKDHSHSVWQGMIHVDPVAVKTDGYQSNRNLILSPDARADSIPGLEILANDVRCTHGATVGKIDNEQIFYLKSRGIPEKEAVRLIVEGFFEPIMQRIPFEEVRERFQNAIHQKIASEG